MFLKNNSENLVYKKFYYIGPWNYPYYPPIFICENNKKGNKIMHCVDLFLSDSFEDMGIFHVFQFIFDGEGLHLSITDR